MKSGEIDVDGRKVGYAFSRVLLKDVFVPDSTEDLVFQGIKSSAVKGEKHLLAAIRGSTKAFERDQNVSESRGLEFMVWLAGNPQISKAIAEVGVAKDDNDAVLVAFGQGNAEKFLKNKLERFAGKEIQLKQFSEDEKLEAVEKTAFTALEA